MGPRLPESYAGGDHKTAQSDLLGSRLAYATDQTERTRGSASSDQAVLAMEARQPGQALDVGHTASGGGSTGHGKKA